MDHHEDAELPGLAELPDHVQDHVHEEGGQAFRRLVHEEVAWLGAQRPCDGQHGLLAPGQVPRAVVRPRLQAREEAEEPVQGPPLRAAAGGGDEQVLPDRQGPEDAAPLGDEPDALRAISWAGRAVMSWPSSTTRPRRGGVRPAMDRITVVLPTPFRPMRTAIVPRSTSRETPWMT